MTDVEQSARVLTMEWRDNQLNAAIGDAQFTLPTIGVVEGDRIHDQTTDVYYRYKASSADKQP